MSAKLWRSQEEEWASNYHINRVKTGRQSVGDQMSWRQDAVEKTSTQQSGPLAPRLSSPGERERNAVMANRVRVNMLQFCSVSNSLSHTTLSNKVRGIFFKRIVSLVFIVSLFYDSACRCICVCIVGHGYITNVAYLLYSYKNNLILSKNRNHCWYIKKFKKRSLHNQMYIERNLHRRHTKTEH